MTFASPERTLLTAGRGQGRSVTEMIARSILLERVMEEHRCESPVHGPASHENMTPLALRVHGEYKEMPGLRLTVRQAARLFSLAPDVAHSVLDELRQASVLTCSVQGTYSLNR